MVIGRRRSLRRASTEASPDRRIPHWLGRAALLCLALGLVLMHHLIGAHQHSSIAPAAVTSVSGQPADHLEHGAGRTTGASSVRSDPSVAVSEPSVGDVGVGTVRTQATGSTALLHEHREPDDRSAASMLLHMCLAVLAAAAALIVLALVAWWWRTSTAADRAVQTAVSLVPRAPPAPARLARLQVLRL